MTSQPKLLGNATAPIQAKRANAARRVLILDDDLDLVEALTDILDSRGYAVAAASSEASAQETLTSFDAQVALVDVRLGSQNGLDAIPRLSKLHPDLLFILVTAFADADTAIRALHEGVVAFLRKPLAPPDLLATLEQCFTRIDLERDKHRAEEALRCRNDDLSRINTVLADTLTRAREARQDKISSERRELAILEASFDPIVCVDATGTIRFASKATVRVFGWSPKELTGQSLRLLVPDTQRDAFDQHFPKIAQTGSTEYFERPLELEACHRNGATVPCEVAITRVNPAGGEEGLLVGIIRDLTDHKQAEREKADLEAQLRQSQRMDALGQLAGGIAHDFNNLLTVIIGNVEVLRAQTGASEAEDIAKAAEHAATLTKRLLQFSRKSRSMPTVGVLDTMIEENSTLFRHALLEDIEVSITLGSERARISADPGDIQQVIMNLCVNARDAMPSGGAIFIETSKVGAAESIAGRAAQSSGPFVLLSVRDTGCGMDEETRSRALEPFFTTKPEGKGTGVGLSTIFGIVAQSQGFVEIDSRPGAGTTIRVYFPEVQTGARSCSPATGTLGASGGSETVLVVEDNHEILSVTKRVLEAAGYSVIAASSPDQALILWPEIQNQVELLLTDFIMPGMNGSKLARHLTEARPDLKVLFMTGYAPNIGADTIESGAALLEKPFSPEDLRREVRQVLDRALR